MSPAIPKKRIYSCVDCNVLVVEDLTSGPHKKRCITCAGSRQRRFKRIAVKKYAKNNPEKLIKYRKLYVDKNRGLIAAKEKEYRQKNNLAISQRNKDYREKNKSKMVAYRKKHKDRSNRLQKEGRYKKKYGKLGHDVIQLTENIKLLKKDLSNETY